MAAPAFNLYNLFPLAIRMRDEQASGTPTQDPILKRITDLVEDEQDVQVALLVGMRDLLRPSSTTTLVLSLLAKMLGVTEYQFNDIVTNKSEFVASLPYHNKIKGTLLSLVREIVARDVVDVDYQVHEIWKDELYAVDEYVPNEEDTLYGSGYAAARVVFLESPFSDDPSDGSITGIFVEDQIPYSEAKAWRETLNNVFPIHVIVPPNVERSEFEDSATVEDDIEGQVYALLTDNYRVDYDDLSVIFECVSACQVGCQERCETLCENSCESTCEQACQAFCEADCQATCQSFCQSGCEQGCQDACQSFCQSECQTFCQSACEINCQQQCQFGCQNANESCISFCQVNCQTDAEVVCSDQCQVSCQSDAQSQCPPGELPGGEGG